MTNIVIFAHTQWVLSLGIKTNVAQNVFWIKNEHLKYFSPLLGQETNYDHIKSVFRLVIKTKAPQNVLKNWALSRFPAYISLGLVLKLVDSSLWSVCAPLHCCKSWSWHFIQTVLLSPMIQNYSHAEPEFDMDAFLLDTIQLLGYSDPAKEGCIVISVG